MKTVYHCSRQHITEFDFTYGVHFGGFYSALEAGLRKCSQDDDKLFLHVLELLPCSLTDSEDVGSEWKWDGVLKYNKPLGFDGVFYVNKYEPDVVKSYYLWKNVVCLKEVVEISAEEANKLLDKQFDSAYS